MSGRRPPTRFVALLLAVVLAACAAPPEREGERTRDAKQAFTSAEATLFDFAIDGRLLIDDSTDPDPRALIVSQLMYSVGHLNADRALGRFERLELSAIRIKQISPETDEVSYHANLPVAWADGAAPEVYSLTLPARVTESDQMQFASKYGTTCVDPTTGSADATTMFLLYRPRTDGCVLDPNDVVTFDATVTPSSEMSSGTYPEYDRVWEDRALDVVAMFSRMEDTPVENDEGVAAFREFVSRASELVSALQPRADRRESAPLPASLGAAAPPARVAATLDDGRTIRIDAMLVSHHLVDDGARFDDWFDAITPDADAILYGGHASLGENVRVLMSKGSFRPRQYVVWAVNGCDTLAYLDRTLAERRAELNPDDPAGTKYMDQVSNVMPGFFHSTPAFAMSFVSALLAATQTYQEVLATIDPEQVVVVTGDEDNVFRPSRVRATPPRRTALPQSAASPPAAVNDGRQRSDGEGDESSGCVMGRSRGGTPAPCGGLSLLVGVGLVVRRRRRHPRARALQ